MFPTDLKNTTNPPPMTNAKSKRYAVIDTESSGLFDFAKPAHEEGQPRLASLAIITVSETATDATTEIHRANYFIRPEGWEMKPEVTAINGLTTDFLRANGRPIKDVLEIYSALIADGYIVAAFNAQFDTKMLRGELRRAGMPDLFEQTPNICLMRACTPVCKVPKKTGAGYKFPKLAEACAFFGIVQPAAHSAMGDADSAKAILVELYKLNLVPVPEVHYAKERPAGSLVATP